MQHRKPLRFWYALSALACLAIVLIGVRDQLGFYIHPRYHWFTLILAGIGCLVLVKAVFDYKYTGKPTVIQYDHAGQLLGKMSAWLLHSGAWFVLIVLGLLLWSPAKPLLSRAAEQKEKQTAPYAQFVYDAAWYNNPSNLNQISTVLSTPDGPEDLEGQQFTLTGFVRASKDGNPDIFRLSRFVISCCAVDATPTSIAVYQQGWSKNLNVDEWVEVSGILKTSDFGGKQVQALSDITVKKIEQPQEPYEFITY